MANNTGALVSIYIPTKNRLELLQRALQSCLHQSYPTLEVIIVDDGSSPEIQRQLQEYCREFRQVTLILNSVSVGASQARNQAIALAKGHFITGLDDDDEFTKERITEFVNSWQASDSFLCSGYWFFLANGQQIRSGRKAQSIGADDLLNANLVGNQLFTKTSYLQELGGFDPLLVACQDYDMWIRLTQRFGTGRRINNFSYLVHQEHEFERISITSRRIKGHQQLIAKHQHLWSPQQLKTQHFLSQLHSGAPVSLKLWRQAGWRHFGLLLKMWLVARWHQLFYKMD
jgi:glycosyltransferase involved in cell wall biosynthesis